MGESCIRFLDRLDQNSGFHGIRKCPMTNNAENDVSTTSLLFFIRSLELGALEHLNDFP